MRIDELRIYVECYEQGIDLKEYILSFNYPIKIVSLKKGNFKEYITSSIVAKFLKVKNFDAFITFISSDKEYPFLAFEYSTAVPTDDHIQQRFDGIYWAAKLQIPFVKISPTDINNTDFGGGTKLKPEHEILASLNIEGIYKHFNWSLVEGTDFVDVNPERVSCPKKINNLEEYLILIKKVIEEENNYEDIYSTLYEIHKAEYRNLLDEGLPNFENSTRLNFLEGNKLILKFNRFGHGMDPEKGMLYFYQASGKKVSIKFEMYRQGRVRERGGYNSLYDGINNKDYIIQYIINRDFNIINETCLYLFKLATSTEGLFENSRIYRNEIIINNERLRAFLYNGISQTLKSLFIFGEEIILSGKDEELFIRWNKQITEEYLRDLIQMNDFEYKILPLIEIRNELASEDILTYTIQEFLRNKYKYEIIGVSYPGAQGDRAIKTGSGRSNKREFIDIIAYKNEQILLIEVKEKLINSVNDIEKLKTFILNEEKVEKMKNLVKTLSSNYDDRDLGIKIGVCGKGNDNLSIDKTMLMIQFNPANLNNLEEFYLILTCINKENLIQNDLNSSFKTVYVNLYYVI